MPRFVILTHIDAAVHYDVMFERDGALKTFTVRDEPGGSEDIEAEQRFDHPLRFLDYEGDLRGAVGKVERWDRGEYDALDWRDELIELDCRGGIWNCRVTLVRISPDKWLLKKNPR